MNNKINIPQTLPLLPLRDTVVFPYMLLSLYVGRDISKSAVNESINKSRIIFLVTQKDAQEQKVSADSVFKMGTAAIILRTKTMKDGRLKVLVQGLSRGSIESLKSKESYYEVNIQEIQDLEDIFVSQKTKELIEKVKFTLKTIITLGGQFSPDLLMILDEITHPGHLADLITGHFELKIREMQSCLEICDPENRLKKLLQILNKEIEIIRMQNRIKKMVKNNLSKFQNDSMFNNQQPPLLNSSYASAGQDIKAEEIQEVIKKIEMAEIPEPAREETLKQVSRLEKMHPESSEASMIRGYLDWVVELPWNKSTQDNLDIDKASQVLEADHFGLYDVKERILEFMAVHQLKQSSA